VATGDVIVVRADWNYIRKTRLIESGRFAASDREKRRRKAGDLYVSGLHAQLREAPEQWGIHRLAENGEETHGGKAARN
jgi:hypothetical protein